MSAFVNDEGGGSAYQVMQPVRTLGLLALVRFLGWPEGVAAGDGDGDGLLGLLPGSALDRLESILVVVVNSQRYPGIYRDSLG